MALDAELRARIEQIVHSNAVVLFMKGNRHFPQCGFSAQVVKVLETVGAKQYETVNILADAALREGMKEYSQWPTFPQLYVNGELVGGCDIVKEMHASGELSKVLGLSASTAGETTRANAPAPTVALSESAAAAFKAAADDAAGDVLRLEIDPRFQNDLFFAPKAPGDIVVESRGIAIHMDASTAGRADGMTIDFVKGAGGAGFKIENPNAPPRVKSLTARELKAMLDDAKVVLFDVRPEVERARAKIAAARPLAEPAVQEELMAMPKDAAIALHCHHGIRSRNAGEELLREGFTNVYNLEGGIAAWSADVDPSVPRY